MAVFGSSCRNMIRSRMSSNPSFLFYFYSVRPVESFNGTYLPTSFYEFSSLSESRYRCKGRYAHQSTVTTSDRIVPELQKLPKRRVLPKKKKPFRPCESIDDFFWKMETARDVAEVLCNFGWDSGAEDAISVLTFKWDSYLLTQVLKYPIPVVTAWSFFKWLRDKTDFRHDTYTYNSMIDLLGRNGDVALIPDLMKCMPDDGCGMNLILFNTVMKWYGKTNNPDKALGMWKQMQSVGCKPNVITFNILIQMLAKSRDFEEVAKMYTNLLDSNCKPNSHTYNLLISCLVATSKLDAAVEVFEKLLELKSAPTATTFSILLNAFAKVGNVRMVKYLYSQMQLSGYLPNNRIYCSFLDSLHHSEKFDSFDEVVKDMESFLSSEGALYGEIRDEMMYDNYPDTGDLEGHDDGSYSDVSDIEVDDIFENDTSTISSSTGRLPIMLDRKVFCQLVTRWGPEVEKALESSLMRWDPPKVLHMLMGLSDPKIAFGLFNWVKSREGYKHDKYTYSKIIAILAKNKCFGRAERELEELQREGINLNGLTFNTLISALAKEGKHSHALKIFFWMKVVGLKPNTRTYTSLIGMFTKARSYDKALEIYKEMMGAGCTPDSDTYGVMICCLGADNKVEAAYHIFKRMQEFGCKPNRATYFSLVDALVKNEEYEKAIDVFNTMREHFEEPTAKLYHIIEKAFKRTSRIEDAAKIHEEMILAHLSEVKKAPSVVENKIKALIIGNLSSISTIQEVTGSA